MHFHLGGAMNNPQTWHVANLAGITLMALGVNGCLSPDELTAPLPGSRGVIGSVAQTDTLPAAGQVIPNRYMVVFNDGINDVPGAARALAAAHHAKILYLYTAALKGMGVELPDQAVAALRRSPVVKYVEQDRVVRAHGTQTGAPWGLDRIDQRSLPLDGNYTYNGDGTGVRAYILDSGIYFSHSEFGGRASAGIDEVTPGGNADDCDGHGTHVAGTVGGATYGVAKNVTLIAVRVLNCSGGGTTLGVNAGIDWVTANRVLPAVANMSLGGAFQQSTNTAVANSIASGVTYVLSAGNCDTTTTGACASGTGPYPACNYSPAGTPGAITVGSTDINDRFSSFSYYGGCVAVNAPGRNITSAYIGSPSAWKSESGTSMAAPHVAGAAAIYLSAFPAASPTEVKAVIQQQATSGVLSSVPSGTPNLLLYSRYIYWKTFQASFTGPRETSYPQRCDWAINATGGAQPYAYSILIEDFGFQPNQSSSANLTAGVYTTAYKTVLVRYSVTDAVGQVLAYNGSFDNKGYTSSDPYCHY
jgi:subtilisin family serine protease